MTTTPLTPVTPTPAAPPQKMPWHVCVTLAIAFGALWHISGGMPLLLVLIALMGASYILPYRLGDHRASNLMLRALVLAVVLFLNQGEPESSDALFGPVKNRNIFGLLYASEATIQFWRQRKEPLSSHLLALLMAGMVFLTACNTMDDSNIRWWTPPFLFAMVLSVLQYRRHSAGRLVVTLRAVALLVTLMMGAASYRAVVVNRGELLDLGNRLIGDRFQFERSGMSQQPILGATFGLRGSAQRVLRLQQFEGDPHLRGLSFDVYDTGTWGPRTRERNFQPANPTELSPPGAEAIPGSTAVTVTRLVSENTLLYAPLNTAAIDLGEAEGGEWAAFNGGPIRVRAKAPYEYIVTVPPKDSYQGILATKIAPEAKERYLQLPQVFDNRLRILAQRIAGKKKTAPEKIEAVVTYLLNNYTYSLSFDPGPSDPLASAFPGANDPLAKFLLSNPKRGAHCEYFGTAAAVLLRCVGVPTRYVTGYFAHEGGGEGITIVRQRDAHAWCEAWVDGIGWITVDATPGSGLPDHKPEPVEWWRSLQERFQDGLQALATLLANLTPEQMNIALGTLVIGILLWGVWARYRRMRTAPASLSPFVYTATDTAIVKLVERFEAVFVRHGHRFPEYRTYEEHLAVLSKEDQPETRPLVPLGKAFVHLYNRVRFGGGADEEMLSALRRSTEELEKLSYDRTRR
jgi:transglutaminase-like putative cysteine protease